ncbi:hypothetical protein ES708_12863 [subsurface metagenome]
MKGKWVSTGMYEHPAKHQMGTYGHVILSQTGVYYLLVSGIFIYCSQIWAEKIHYDEKQVTQGSIQTFMAAGKAKDEGS